MAFVEGLEGQQCSGGCIHVCLIKALKGSRNGPVCQPVGVRVEGLSAGRQLAGAGDSSGRSKRKVTLKAYSASNRHRAALQQNGAIFGALIAAAAICQQQSSNDMSITTAGSE